MALLFPGNVVSFSYPSDNRTMARARYARRRVVIERVRDLAREPLDPLTTWLDPWLRRGRRLVVGHDLDRQARRSFYVDSMRLIRPLDLPLFRLGAYDPLEPGPIEWCGPVLSDSPAELAVLRRALLRAYRLARARPDSTRALAIFPLGVAAIEKSSPHVPAFAAAVR